MDLEFHKYNATGNDFIIIHDPKHDKMDALIKEAPKLCHRNFGIGADGILTINESSDADFSIFVINSDGSVAEMCANGARACLHFFHHELNGKNDLKFVAVGGTYSGTVEGAEVNLKTESEVSTPDIDLNDLDYSFKKYVVLGIPHLILEVGDIEALDICEVAPPLRHDPRFPLGVNVNFFQKKGETIHIRSFERGIEGETLSCGTGIMATAYALQLEMGMSEIQFQTKGGQVSAKYEDGKISYKGSVEKVFSGTLNL